MGRYPCNHKYWIGVDMNASTIRSLFGVFLLAHGLITMSLATVPPPAPGALRTPFFPSWWRTDVDNAWPAIRLGITPAVASTVGWLLWLVVLLFFLGAGLGLLGAPILNVAWHPLAAIGAVLSFLLLGLFWHPWLVLGVLINLGILLGGITGWFTRWLAV